MSLLWTPLYEHTLCITVSRNLLVLIVNNDFILGRSLQQIKSDVGEKGDLGIVAEVSILH